MKIEDNSKAINSIQLSIKKKIKKVLIVGHGLNGNTLKRNLKKYNYEE